ncbi:MAG: hypothetical protein JWM91_2540, partial [Rhodospirillales bacterium]|nr:hypothetical protein [Rhodospirillales bacterium]
PHMARDARAREVCGLILSQPVPNIMPEPIHALAVQASIDLLPVWAQRMHRLRSPPLSRPLVRAGMFGIARTLRWAFK